jgi:hypothetical protein
VSVSVSVASPHVALAVALNSDPSNPEYVAAPREQSGVPAVAASHWSSADVIALLNCARPWYGIVPAFWHGNETLPEMQMTSS